MTKATTKKSAAATFDAESLYDVRVSAIHDSEKFKQRFSPAHTYKVKGKVAEEIQAAGKLKSHELRRKAETLNLKDAD